MFVVGSLLTFNGTVKSNSLAGANVYYFVTTPTKLITGVTAKAVTGWTSTTDGTIAAITYTPTVAGLYKISVYADSDFNNAGNHLGDFLFNVVESTLSTTFTLG